MMHSLPIALFTFSGLELIKNQGLGRTSLLGSAVRFSGVGKLCIFSNTNLICNI